MLLNEDKQESLHPGRMLRRLAARDRSSCGIILQPKTSNGHWRLSSSVVFRRL